MYFSEEKVSEIIEKNDIVDLISQYLSLNKRGNNFWGLCPFHTEKTPSFSVSNEKQMFYCFGCGTGGNVVTFIQKIERLNYVEALYFLAKKARISIDERTSKKDLESIKRKELLFNINSTAARFFYDNLKVDEKAMNYLIKRGLNKEIIRKFGIGYSLNSWDRLNAYLNAKGFDNNLIENAGLIVKKEKGYYDRFRGRIMFPIINLGGKVVAFGGRVLDDSKPKYLNSPETPIYNKSRSIYALNMIREIPALQSIIIVEGYMDVISLYQFGIKNVVASLGTAFTVQQAKLLKRYANDIIIAYDSDTAGQTATIKGLSILEKEGCRVKVINLPKGMDPDDFIRKEGIESFNNSINNSLSLIEYRIYNSRKNSDPKILEHRIRFSKSLAMILSTLKSPIEIDAYIKKYSKEMQISEEAIYGELKKIRSKHISGNNRHNIISKINEKEFNGQLIAEKKVLNICVLYKDKAENIFNIISEENFSVSLNQKIASIINLKIKEGKTISAGEILTHLIDEEERQKASEIFKTDITDKDIELLDSYIDKLHYHSMENRIKELTDKMNEYYRLEEKKKANELFKEIMDLQKRKK